jgi:hypothetical protein
MWRLVRDAHVAVVHVGSGQYNEGNRGDFEVMLSVVR